MAAELDYLADGTAAMFSVKQTPWHREGHIVREAPTLEEGMAMAGHNFDVELRPAHLRKETDGGEEYFVPAPDSNLIVRTDRMEVLGHVGGYYRPLQNGDAFRVLEPLLDAGLAELETGGTLRGGRDVWMMVRFRIDNPVVQEVFTDEVVPFGLISNNHSGSRAVIVQETPIRVVCANTLSVAVGGMSAGVRVRHTQNVTVRTVEAAESLWGSLTERYARVAQAYQRLKAHFLDEEMFRRLVLDVAAPIPQELQEKELTARQETSRRRLEERRARLTQLWDEGDGHTGDRSAWEAYGAVTQSVDHDVEHWPVRTLRTQQMMGGSLAATKDAVLRSLLTVA